MSREEMPRKANEIAVKWIESKNDGKTNCVNVKHVIGQLKDIAVGAEVTVRFNAKRYCTTVADLLDWVPPMKKTKPSMKQKPRKEKKDKQKNQQRYHCNCFQG